MLYKKRNPRKKQRFRNICNKIYIIDQGKILKIIDVAKFKETGRDFEEYFLSITKREARIVGKSTN